MSSARIVVDVLYALMIFQAFMILPQPDDSDLKYYSLNQIVATNIDTLLVIAVGLILIKMYRIQFNNPPGNHW